MTAAMILGFASMASAADKAPAMAPAMAAPGAAANMKVEDCPAMMRSLVPLPTKLGELMMAVADGMDGHAAWVGASKDKGAKSEAAAMKKIAKDHRDVATQTKKIVADMEAAGKLTPAPHDTSKVDPKMGEQLMKQAALEREMAAMMIKHADDTDKMLKEMAKGAPTTK
jgi:hypothetical protein